jgi:hypothetical protein
VGVDHAPYLPKDAMHRLEAIRDMPVMDPVAMDLLEGNRAICQEELRWDVIRCREDERADLDLWKRCYSLTPREEIPDRDRYS